MFGLQGYTDATMILYKYLHPDRVDVLKNRQIRFTQPGDFNDPFEFRPQIANLADDSFVRKQVEDNFERILDQELAKVGSLIDPATFESLRPLLRTQKHRLPAIVKLLHPQLIGMISPRIDSFFNQNVGVLCLSEVRDSLLMWGHYTDNHRGLVVGFDSENSFFLKRRTAQDEFGLLRQVEYQRRRPSVTLSDTSSAEWFQTKSEEWAYEKEWRIARVLSDSNKRIDATPFPIYLFQFPADAVSQIILGIRAADGLVDEIQRLKPAFPNAKVLRMEESSSEYRLVAEEFDKKKAVSR